ncbi:hypothetical protein SBI67_06585 [Mycolicibacterium sp. 120266]|uniref:hypothetical protein n=1 Tax=Mycolicibacterium sp. 120266 TaxID=3090601 RepID=UPI00299E49CE|nr:hypothetical protein [Mycolicibacterium sp. 120266]MDX1871778.1 hypothetical protein [Mycolicibacterium sp. 120266]
MSANAVSDRVSVLAAFDAYDSACEALAGLDFTAFSVAELLALQSAGNTGLARPPVWITGSWPSCRPG